MPLSNPYSPALILNRSGAIRDHARAYGKGKVQLDVSGGIDSAVMLCLCAEAVGEENVIADFSGIQSKDVAANRAMTLMDALHVKPIMLHLDREYNALLEAMLNGMLDAGYDMAVIRDRIEKDPTVLGSIRSCLRAPIGRGFNRIAGGGIRQGTGNEDEDRFLRFYQKGGDGEVDTNPIAMLSKGEVLQLAVSCGWYMGAAVQAALRPIIEAAPDHDLWAGKDSRDVVELKAWSGVDFTYSTVDPESGVYTSVGTIERVNRFLDYPLTEQIKVQDILFDSPSEFFLDVLAKKALSSGIFEPFSLALVRALLQAASTCDARTRHKLNPNIPTLGTRQDLLDAGILTNNLPL